MAIPRFKPDYIWNDNDWANLPIKGSDLAVKLRAAGFKVLGVVNGKPTLQEEINTTELQLIVIKLLRGDVSETPKPISSTPAFEPKKKRDKK